MSTSTEKDQVIFRSRETLRRLTEKAGPLGLSPHQLAKELVKIGLDEGWADGRRTRPGPPPPDVFEELIMRAAFAVIVALSPTMNEADTADWVAEVFGRPSFPGSPGVPPAGP